MADKKFKSSEISDSEKKASIERLKNQYYQAISDSDKLQVKRLESILKRLGVEVRKG